MVSRVAPASAVARADGADAMSSPWAPTGRLPLPHVPLRVRGSDTWNRLCARAYVPLSTVADVRFRGEMVSRDLGAANVSHVGSTAAVVSRDRSLVRSDPRESVIFSIFLSAGGSLAHGTARTRLGAGDGYFLDTDTPYSVRFHEPYDMLAVRLPISSVSIGRRTIASISGGAIASGLRELGVLRRHLALLIADLDVGAESEEASSELLSELFSLLARRLDDPEASRVPMSNGALLTSAQHFMLRHFDRPAFGVEDVAREYAITRRHLEHLFARLGSSPAAHLRELRLRRGSQLLAATGGASVEQASARAGFGDVNTFIRSFRRRWGMTPLRWRSTLRASLDAARSEGAKPRRERDLLTDLSRVTWSAVRPSETRASARATGAPATPGTGRNRRFANDVRTADPGGATGT
ncbi:AraC family transcriptional regulator [Leucobacter zeae]|nr:AraC family transcriptional regulator [Leucobacter zeae]